LSLRTETAPRVAQRRPEQMQPHVLAADRHPRLAEVDLQLAARRRLEARLVPRLRRGGRRSRTVSVTTV
jgi:hypothetical protein